MSLSPWDLSAQISFDFSLYRSRRDSYVYATQVARGQRNASYRRATKHSSASTPMTSHDNATSDRQETGSSLTGDEEDVERLKLPPRRKKRALSYRAAVRHTTGEEELSTVDEGLNLPADDKRLEDTSAVDEGRKPESTTPPLSPSGLATPLIGRYRSTKNLLVLSLGFVFIFSAFRALQNLQTSVHQGRVGALVLTLVHQGRVGALVLTLVHQRRVGALVLTLVHQGRVGALVLTLVHQRRVGALVLTLVHGLALITGFLGPLVVSRVGPRWSIVLAALIYPAWVASNLCVTGGVVFYIYPAWVASNLCVTGGVVFYIYPAWVASNLCVTGGVIFYIILLTTSALVGVAQSLAWSAQVCTPRL